MGIRVLVTGDREWLDNTYIWNVLDVWHRNHTITNVIQGMARGADSIAMGWARIRGVDKEEDHYHAEWDNPKYRTTTGKSFAGNIRNQRMLDEGRPDVVLAFHPDLDNSRGTRDMVQRATKAGIEVFVYDGQ
jgi:hypothetical protein